LRDENRQFPALADDILSSFSRPVPPHSLYFFFKKIKKKKGKGKEEKGGKSAVMCKVRHPIP
jgi:hypothetical protein